MQISRINLNDFLKVVGLERDLLNRLVSQPDDFYYSFDLAKKRGGFRHISASKGHLKQLQRFILENFFNEIPMPPHLHGSIKGRGIATNAQAHIDKPVVINLDLQDFFSKISSEQVLKALLEIQIAEDVAEFLINVTTYQNCLPQGAPTSPFLSNLTTMDLDSEIMMYLNRKFLRTDYAYTRYVDDITISGPSDLTNELGALFGIIRNAGYNVNQRKVSIKRRGARQMVTGIVVNKKLGPPKGLVRQARQQMYFCKKFGIDEHCKIIETDPAIFLKRFEGKLQFISLSQPETAARLRSELNEVLGLENSQDSKELFGSEYKPFLADKIQAAIDFEKTISFEYDSLKRCVAPVKILESNDGALLLRGFELSPAQHWRTFRIIEIENMTIIETFGGDKNVQ